jgi:hypothetical protein
MKVTYQFIDFPSTYRLPALERSQIWKGLSIDLSPLQKGFANMPFS